MMLIDIQSAQVLVERRAHELRRDADAARLAREHSSRSGGAGAAASWEAPRMEVWLQLLVGKQPRQVVP
jgi:hypothetical protein